MESPVCTPIGSKFSIEQIMMQLSFLSRTTSISYSFQPNNDSSSNTSLVGERSNPCSIISLNSSRLYAIPPPLPPMVKDGRITVGKPKLGCCCIASSKLCAMAERADFNPISSIALRNNSRSSAISMASFFAPIISTEYFSSTPSRSKSNAQFNAV